MRIVQIGAGYWGVNYIRELAGNLACVVETNQDRANYVQEKYNVRVESEIPEDLNYDAAIIATPPRTHMKLAKPILETGRQVLIEKPMATFVEEALPLKKYSKQIMVGHIYLYHPGIEMLKAKLSDFSVDHIFSRRTNDGPVRDWEDATWDLAAHDISIMNYLTDSNPIAHEAFRMKDWAIINLEYIALHALIYVSWLGGPKRRSIELVPTKGGERYIFDDVATVLEISPMRLMLNDFMSGKWRSGCTYEAALNVITVLGNL